MRGVSFDYYVTHAQGCSCRDFHNRKLPCKHMYALAVWLDGDIEKSLLLPDSEAIKGLSILLAGRFAHAGSSQEDIRSQIIKKNAIWEENAKFGICLMVRGEHPSQSKVNYANEYRLPVLSESDVLRLFSKDNSNVSEDAMTQEETLKGAMPDET